MKNLKAVMAVSTIGAVFVSAVLFGQNKPGATKTVPSSKLAPAPAWILQDADGKFVRSSDFKGKVVILDFWATWCGPCGVELPGFAELQEKYGKRGLAVIGVSVDLITPGEVKKFAQQSGVNYTLVVADTKVTQDFGGIKAVPTTFVIDREGRIVKQHVGFTEKAEFEKEVKPLLTR